MQSSDAVRAIGAEQVPYFRTAEFSELMLENERLIKKFAHTTDDSRVVFMTCSGSGGMETAIMNCLTKADKALVINGGSFGERFVELLGEQSILLPHAEETVRRIAEKLPVIIVTNGITAVQKKRFAKSPLKDLAAAVVISEEIGVAKPDPEMFRIALRPFEIAPEDALMIGDRLSGDILGANNAGLDACWYNPAGLPLTGGVHAEYIISDIRDCVKIALQE